MKNLTLSAVAVAAILVVNLYSNAAEKLDPLPPNAALKYWMAFERVGKIDAADAKWVSAGFNAPAGVQRTAAVVRFEPALVFMRRGAAIERCDWGLESALDGPATLLPHLGKMRELSRIASLTARELSDAKRFDQSSALLIDILKMARHTSSDGTLISRLVNSAIDNTAVAALAALAPSLPPEKLKALAVEFAALPQPESLAGTIRNGEGGIVRWMRKELAGPDGRKNLTAMMSQSNLLSGEMERLAMGLVPDKLIETWMKECETQYERLAQLMDLPYDEFLIQSKLYDANLQQAGMFARTMIPAVSNSRKAIEKGICQRALLKAGFQILIEGEAASAKTVDPYGAGQPFIYTKTAFGFELRSRLSNDKTSSLVFGFDPAIVPIAAPATVPGERPGAPVKPPKPPEPVGQF